MTTKSALEIQHNANRAQPQEPAMTNTERENKLSDVFGGREVEQFFRAREPGFPPVLLTRIWGDEKRYIDLPLTEVDQRRLIECLERK